MSSVSSLGALTGAQSSSGTSAARRAASAGAAFNLMLQNLTEKANADALAARAAAPSPAQSAISFVRPIERARRAQGR